MLKKKLCNKLQVTGETLQLETCNLQLQYFL